MIISSTEFKTNRAQTPVRGARLKDAIAEAETSKAPAPLEGERSTGLLLLLIFSLTFGANLLSNLTSRFPNAVFAHDGHHYLTTCRYLTNVLLGFVHGAPDVSLLFAKPFPAQLICDGPVVPGIPALVFTALGHSALGTGWRIFVGTYSVMAAITACLVAFLTFRLTGSRAASLAAGLALGLLPSTIIASGRFCSEVPATLFLFLFFACLATVREHPSRAVVAGIFAGIVALTKAVLLPVVGLCTLWTLFKSPRKLLLSGLLAASLTLTLLPWVTYTKATTGKASVTVERVPSLNASVATDLETDGWECVPPSDWMAYMMVNNDALSALTGPWLSRPGDLLKLSVRKYTRLFAIPWNTFRVDVFGLTPQAQVYVHNLLLLLGAFGIAIYLLAGRRKLSYKATMVGDLCLISLMVHIGFSVLQALARYAFTGIPIFAMFAGYGLLQIGSTQARRLIGGKVIVASAMLAALFVASVHGADWLTRLQQSHEVTYELRRGDAVEKQIALAPRNYLYPPREAFVLVDADKSIYGADLSVNGHAVSTKLRPLAQYDTWLYINYVTSAEQTELLDISEEDLRQWRAVPVPISWINLQGTNDIVLTCKDKGARIYADSDPKTRQMLSPRLFAHDQMFNSTSGYEPRVENAVLCGRASQSSTLLAAGAPGQLLPGSLRIKLALVCRENTNQPRISNLPHDFTMKVGPKAFNVMLRDGDSVNMSYYLFRFAPYTFGTVRLPELPKTSHLHIQVTGLLRTDRPGGIVGMPVSILTSTDHEMMLGKCPNYIKGTREWTPFSIDDLIPTTVFEGIPKEIKVALFPCHWQQAWYGCASDAPASELKGITVRVSAVDYPILSNGRTLFY